MSIRFSTLITAGLFGSLLLVGSIIPVHAGDGCEKDRKDSSTADLTSPIVSRDDRVG